MPAITRSQNINVVVKDKVIRKSEMKCSELVSKIRNLLSSMESCDKQTKVIITTEIFRILSSEMMKHEKFYKNKNFILTVYNKTFSLENQLQETDFMSIDKNIIENLRTELIKIRPIFEPLIANIKAELLLQDSLDNSQRPKRNLQRVNYAGMDMNSDDEGEICVFKPWFENGKIIEKMSKRQLSDVNELDDEDYVLEEEQDEKEQVCKRIWAKATQGKEEIIPRRTRKQINYAGMDMNEEDEGTVNISKRWFENGKVTYKWSKRSLSEVNEIDDEDYMPDMY